MIFIEVLFLGGVVMGKVMGWVEWGKVGVLVVVEWDMDMCVFFWFF